MEIVGSEPLRHNEFNAVTSSIEKVVTADGRTGRGAAAQLVAAARQTEAPIVSSEDGLARVAPRRERDDAYRAHVLCSRWRIVEGA